MNKSLGTLLLFWGVFQFTQVQPLPSPHKQCWTHVSRIFSEIQLCIGRGEGELQENFENNAVLRGGREMTGKYAYCSTVPRTFVQDCSCNSSSTLSLYSRLSLNSKSSQAESNILARNIDPRPFTECARHGHFYRVLYR